MSKEAPSLDDQVHYLMRGTALEGLWRAKMESELRAKLQRGTPLRVKLGLDPVRPSLHIGHLAPLLALKRFADLGHRTYLLIGGFTALIGDPMGRKRKLPPLTEESVAAYAEQYIRQSLQVLDPARTIVVNNATWLRHLDMLDFFQASSRVTLARMLQHADFRRRFAAKKNVGIQELLYPIAQALDSMLLAAAPPGRENDPAAFADALGKPESACDVEVGGKDQLFNFTLTRDLMASYGLVPETFVTTPLIVGRDKQKMGRSNENMIYFNDPPYKIYSAIMAIDDDFIEPYLVSLTTIPDDELNQLRQGLREGSVSRHGAKQRLAREVVTLIHNAAMAREAEAEYEERRYGRVPPSREFVVPPEMASHPVPVAELVFAAGLVTERPGQPASKMQARRLVAQGGILVDGRRAQADEKVQVKDGMLLQRGKGRDAQAVRLRVSEPK